MKRRKFLRDLGAGLGLATLGLEAVGQGRQATSKHIDFMTPAPGGRTFATISEARNASLKAGDIVSIRDLSQIAPATAWTKNQTRGKWQLRPYRLADGQTGNLLMVNDRAGDEGPSAVPPDIEVKVDLPGWYAIWVGAPMIELRPINGFYGGVDVALDNDPAYIVVGPERGTRHGKIMGPMNVEVNCFWKCAKLDGRAIRSRVPYGTYLSVNWGLVRGSISSLRLVKLSDKQVKAYRADISNPSTKKVIVVNDGFSHYWLAGEPGKGIDARYAQQYRDSDVKMYFFQTPATGVASWPTRLTSLLGEGVTEDEWKLRRKGDRRAYDYIQWAVKNQQEGYRVLSQMCRQSGPELHASLRMNLFFKNGGTLGEANEQFINGRFWKEHPELRKSGPGPDPHMPGSVQLDYAQPKVRQFISDILKELATKYDVAGISMDFTRWPPIADPAHHEFNVLTGFIKEVRQSLDKVIKQTGRKMVLSAQVTDGYHAGMTLAEQKIDLEAWLASGALDFVCVQAWDHRQYLSWARKYHTPYYLIHDQDSFKTPGGYRDDPDWQQNRPDEDPLPGEEFEEQPRINSGLDPTEWDAGLLDRYKLGIDGVCNGGNFARRLGHVQEMAERVKTGERWGQKVGPTIQVL